MPGRKNARLRPLRELAGLYGVQTGYFDVFDRRYKAATPEGLLTALRALGAPLESVDDAPAAWRRRQRELWHRLLEPVSVAWQGKPARVLVRLPASQAGGDIECLLRLENGEEKRWKQGAARMRLHARGEAGGERFLARRLPLPRGLPPGYHRLRVKAAGRAAESLLIVAPVRAYLPPVGASRPWGVFLPLYALHSRRSPATGDFTDLEALLEWAAGFGAGVVGSLPLPASFLDEPFAPGPYSPVSGLFWNELYLDVARIPELERSPAAKEALSSRAYREELQALGSARLVDYRRAMALKRRPLEELARSFFEQPAGDRRQAFERFRRAHPQAEDYARFRAAVERRRASWHTWPAAQRDGRLQPGDYDEQAAHYHLYVQWQAEEQLHALAEQARQRGPGLYLDLPLGVHPDGYDAWRYRDVFARGVSSGAPPDDFFVKGQDWGSPPLHPERLRERGYDYFITTLRHHLCKAGLLRIDHVMRLHRLFWVPHGRGVPDGVYVRKAAEELYAIVALESHRHRAVVVGEDLGTVPSAVRRAMGRHRLLRSYVLQFEVTTDSRRALHRPPRHSLATHNTHDTRPFAGYWEARDIQDRLELDLVERKEAQQLRRDRRRRREALARYLRRRGWMKDRPSNLRSLFEASLAWLAASPARVVLVNLEDLWQETEQQNTPGTLGERANWRRKARYALEEFTRLPRVREALWDAGRRRRR